MIKNKTNFIFTKKTLSCAATWMNLKDITLSK